MPSPYGQPWLRQTGKSALPDDNPVNFRDEKSLRHISEIVCIYFLCRPVYLLAGKQSRLLNQLTILSCLQECKNELFSFSKEEQDIILARVFEHVSKFSSHDLLVGEKEVSPSDYESIKNLVARLKKGEPLQYVLGEAWFLGLRLEVNKDVLIPRPETEELVEWVTQEIRKTGQMNPFILDVCTGSGCIALALKKSFPESGIIATDSGEEALTIAKKNGSLLNLLVEFRSDDALDPASFGNEDVFNVIVSNPPYIGEDEYDAITSSVRDYEPRQALFTGNTDPLIFYRAIAGFALHHLEPDGLLFFEINQLYGEKMVRLLNDLNFKEVELRKDLSGSDRMIKAKSPKFEF
jgi:release factor glutamine methyltransferase